MKLRTKIKMLAVPAATLGLVAAPIFTATSCSKDYERLFFTVTNNTGLEVEFCDVGASIANMKLGNTYLTYHPKDRATFVDYEATPYYYGKILGRVAGRFKDGKVATDSKIQLQVNEKSKTKNNCLHGGKDALSFKNFTHEIKTVTDGKQVIFKYTSPDGEGGFAGEVDIVATYMIYNDKNWIDTTLEATPKAKTLINLSTHSLFRLGNDGDVLDYQLTIPATQRVEYDKEAQKATGQIPVGLKSCADDTDYYNFDHNGSGKKIGKDIYASAVYDPVSNGYDHIWYVGNIASPSDRYVNLYNPKNHINFKVTALDESVTGFILYANDYPREGQLMSDNEFDQQYAGITIEPYTYFTNDAAGLANITYGPNEAKTKFYTKYRYEFDQEVRP